LRTKGDLTGVTIAGKYQLIRQIGRGGMGAVYEARTVSTLKRCAVKVLLTPELLGDEEVARRFFLEARASGAIESEHVVAAYDSGVDEAGHAYYVMDALRGEDLQQTLKRLGSLRPITAAKIMLQAANGLASAHALGIVHRDVKPANLFLALAADDEIKVKILDFGVAKVKMEVLHESAHELTRTGSMLGTPLYMSPEQVKRASAIDESADVWSLGVVLFECLSGRLPWGKVESFGELIAAVLTQDLPLLQDYAPWVPAELAGIAHGALSRDPSSRTARALELSAALRRFIAADTRLFRDDIAAASEQERSVVEERLSLADTIIMPAGRQSAQPVVRSLGMRTTKPGRALVAAAAACALVGGSAWLMARRVAPRTADPALPLAIANPPAVSEHTAAVPPSTASSESNVSFPLEVAPSGVSVTVDGVPRAVRDGRVQIDGRMGSTHIIELVLGKQRTKQSVVISEHGVMPPKLTSPTADVSRPSFKRVSTDPKPNSTGNVKSEGQDGELDGGLSPEFN
jgi:eukaryotic-like serine/threonine-protein kinase